MLSSAKRLIKTKPHRTIDPLKCKEIVGIFHFHISHGGNSIQMECWQIADFVKSNEIYCFELVEISHAN